MTAPRSAAPRRPSTRLWLGALGLGLTLAGCQTSGTESADREAVRDAIHAEDYQRAVSLAAELQEAAPGDAELIELHRTTTVAYYLDKGRKATLAGKDDEALAYFVQAAEIAPEEELVEHWVVKTNEKLADDWVAVGNEAFASENFSGAAEAYEKVLSYVPGHTGALTGLGQVTILINYRNGLGEDYYKQGIRALADYRLRSARRGFTATNKYLPELGRAKRRATEVDQLLCQQRVEVARGFEAEGLYAGALNEFKFASMLDPDNGDAREGITRLTREAQAAELLREARMLIYRKRFEEALEVLARGEEISSVQGEAFQEARDSIIEQRLESMYQEALVLEEDGAYMDAAAAFEKLLEEVDYYKDARARISTLQGYVALAGDYYAQAEAAEEETTELQHLRSIESFWPEYVGNDGRAIGERIELLEERLEP